MLALAAGCAQRVNDATRTGAGAGSGALSTDLRDPGRLPRVGYLGSLGPDWPAPVAASHAEIFLAGLRELGYVEGKTIAIESRFANNDFSRLPSLVDELLSLPVDVIVAADSRAMRAAEEATTTVPLIMTTSNDPVATGRVQSLARPGGNITGLTISTPGLAGKRLELLKQAAPDLERVAILWQRSRASLQEWEFTDTAARALGIETISLEVADPTEVTEALDAAKAARADAVVVFGTPSLNALNREISRLALRDSLPLVGSNQEWVEAGALMAYAPSPEDLYRRAATYVDKIVKGTSPAELPVEQPRVFDLVVNLETARLLDLGGVDILLAQATRVIR